MTSPGGAVGDYGLAASLFARLKAGGVRTTACVDLVAASGGYMLACTADKILAAPFSTVGSIGAPPLPPHPPPTAAPAAPAAPAAHCRARRIRRIRPTRHARPKWERTEAGCAALPTATR